ncbi:hypothetical protein HY933_00225 [Candidatus Falkowbacteria bacterium]|nr:hypothetical protein [Candidatus Falkowbacteria bacterium]
MYRKLVILLVIAVGLLLMALAFVAVFKPNTFAPADTSSFFGQRGITREANISPNTADAPAPNFSVDLPVGWQERVSEPGILLTAGPKNESAVYFSLSVDRLNTLTLTEYLTYYQAAAKASAPDVEFTGPVAVAVAGRGAQRLEIVSQLKSDPYRAWAVFIPDDSGGLWTLLFSAPADQWSARQAAFEQILSSFSLSRWNY